MPEPKNDPSAGGPDPLADLRLDPPSWSERVEQSMAPLLESPVRLLVAAVAVAVAGAVVGWLVFTGRDTAPPVEATLPTAPGVASAPSTALPTSTVGVVVAHAAGAVAAPGVYELEAGARVADLIEAAGGLTADADGDRLNLAGPLTDGTRVFVPRVGQELPDEVGVDGASPGEDDAVAGGGGGSSGSDAPDLVDLNQADVAELDTLPGIGPTTAQAIVDHRDEHGPFASVDDLIDVHGIGEAKLAQLRDRVRV